MTILIAYATTEGQTRKIARFCADRLAQHHAVELLNLEDAEGLDLARFRAVVLAGSLHMQNFQKALVSFAKSNAKHLSAMPSMFIAVSLAAAGEEEDDRNGLRDCHAAFQAETGWVPGKSLDVAGAFRFTEYDFFKAWMMKRIAASKGQQVDGHSDREYTDWGALGAELDTWVASLAMV